MHQRFVELGQGYSDLYELLELAKTQSGRVQHFLCLKSHSKTGKVISLCLIMGPSSFGDFSPVYICREGIPDRESGSKRADLFTSIAEEQTKPVIEIEVRHSHSFADKELYYQYLIGILRMNHLLPPLQ